MSPNNFTVTTTETETDNDTSLINGILPVRIINRKSKNILNTRDYPKELHGNVLDSKKPAESEYKIELAWFNILGFIYLHYALVEGLFLMHLNKTLMFALVYGVLTGFGITAGAHRLWAHGAYKANLQLRLILVFLQSAAFQNSVIEWVRDHRVHHKYTDTNADPHNASRGFFFSHMGWLLCKKHPDVKKFGSKISIADLTSDPILAFQHKYFLIVMPVCCFLIPALIPWYFWGESFYNGYMIVGVVRYVVVLHITWLINSAAHMWGDKPYDQNIRPVDTIVVSMLAFGEGFHNYHHVFPWDYKTAELGRWWCNYTNLFLKIVAWLGWATDLKTVSEEMIRKRVLRTGDGSHKYAKELDHGSGKVEERDTDHFWGWDDELMTEEDRKDVMIINKTS